MEQPSRAIERPSNAAYFHGPPPGPNGGVKFSFLQIIEHRGNKKLTAFSVVGLDAQERHELEEFGSCAVLARLAVFNIMRDPDPNRHFLQRHQRRRPGTLRGPARTARAVRSSIQGSRRRARCAGG
jgi:hypothetical protein